MRMWMLNPAIHCRKHLLGAHVECHMLLGALRKGKSIQGFLDKKIVEPMSLQFYHDMLVKEIEKRGYKHNSPMIVDVDVSKYDTMVDRFESIAELATRCVECREGMMSGVELFSMYCDDGEARAVMVDSECVWDV